MARDADLSEFALILTPSEAVEPILAPPVRGALLDWLTEIWAGEELAAVGVAPRKRALFGGPPGVGKTTLAHHLAARLGLPLACVQSDHVIDKWLGASEKNLGAVFDCARKRAADGEPVVLFFDEIDSVAAKRVAGAENAQRAMNNVVNILLQRIEAHDGFVIAATNRPREIDQAVWRRFEIQIDLELPGSFEREEIFARYLRPFRLARADLSRFSEAFATASPALIRAFTEHLKRQIVVGPKAGLPMDRASVFDRVVASVAPHPDLGKPRLWSQGARDPAVAALAWPLSTEAPDEAPSPPAQERNVAPFLRKNA